MKKTNWKKIGLIVGITSVVLLAAGSVFAAGGFGAVGENIGSQSKGMATGIKQMGFLIGVLFVVIGLVIFANLKKTNTQAVVPIGMLTVGVCLLALTTFISTGSETLFGSDETTKAQSSLSLE
jgi:preprotein translocase subunit SecG